MARSLTSEQKIQRARALIQEARDLPLPPDGGKYNFSYIAQVKDLLRQARDLVKFIPDRVGASDELKNEARSVIAEADRANQEILH